MRLVDWLGQQQQQKQHFLPICDLMQWMCFSCVIVLHRLFHFHPPINFASSPNNTCIANSICVVFCAARFCAARLLYVICRANCICLNCSCCCRCCVHSIHSARAECCSPLQLAVDWCFLLTSVPSAELPVPRMCVDQCWYARCCVGQCFRPLHNGRPSPFIHWTLLILRFLHTLLHRDHREFNFSPISLDSICIRKNRLGKIVFFLLLPPHFIIGRIFCRIELLSSPAFFISSSAASSYPLLRNNRYSSLNSTKFRAKGKICISDHQLRNSLQLRVSSVCQIHFNNNTVLWDKSSHMYQMIRELEN